MRICERVGEALESASPTGAPTASAGGRTVVVTGGTGFLGGEVVRVLATAGDRVRVLARRDAPRWDRIPGVEYLASDLSQDLAASALSGADALIHCAAETVGGWEQHQTNSLDVTDRLFRAAAKAGVRRVIHVSSIAVMARARGRASVSEVSPLEPNVRERGPYVWGKLESEHLAARLAGELGISLKIVRPGALVDYRNFDPPGALGKRAGNFFVAVGAPSHQLGVSDVTFAAQTLKWMLDNFEEAPAVLHLLAPVLPTKRDLLARLREANPDLTVIWLPTVALIPLSWLALALQKLLRPGRPAIDVAKVFARRHYDTTLISKLEPMITAQNGKTANVTAADCARTRRDCLTELPRR